MADQDDAERTRKSRVRTVGIVAAVIVVLVIGGLICANGIRLAGRQSADETVTAFIGDLSSSINANGHVQPQQEVSLSMETPGIVTDVLVSVGDEVKSGQELIRLDDTEAQRAYEQAQLQVQDAELQLADAKLSVESAQLALDARVHWAPNPNQVASAEAAVANAEAELEQAQAAYDRVAWLPGVSASGPSLQLEQATNSYNEAKSNLNYLYSNRPDVRSAANALESAKLASQQADLNLEQARLNLEAAQQTLGQMILTAPFDGMITAVNVDEGELNAGVVIEIIGADSLVIILDVDELDIGVLEVGQPARVTLEAWPEVTFDSQVLFIAPRATNRSSSSAVVTYQVHLALGNTDLPVRADMSADAQIITFELHDLLLVPNRAIITDPETGQTYVNLKVGDNIAKTEVTIGKHNGEHSQIISGIEAGDELLVSGE